MSIARRFLQVVAFVCTLIVGVASMAVIVMQTTWFKEWLRGSRLVLESNPDYRKLQFPKSDAPAREALVHAMSGKVFPQIGAAHQVIGINASKSGRGLAGRTT